MLVLVNWSYLQIKIDFKGAKCWQYISYSNTFVATGEGLRLNRMLGLAALCTPFSFREAVGGMWTPPRYRNVILGLFAVCVALWALIWAVINTFHKDSIYFDTRGVFLSCALLLNPQLKAHCCVITHTCPALGLEIKLQVSATDISINSNKSEPSCKTCLVSPFSLSWNEFCNYLWWQRSVKVPGFYFSPSEMMLWWCWNTLQHLEGVI